MKKSDTLSWRKQFKLLPSKYSKWKKS